MTETIKAPHISESQRHLVDWVEFHMGPEIPVLDIHPAKPKDVKHRFIIFYQHLFPVTQTLAHRETEREKAGHIYFVDQVDQGTIYAYPVKLGFDNHTLLLDLSKLLLVTPERAQNMNHGQAGPMHYINKVVDMDKYTQGANPRFDASGILPNTPAKTVENV